MRNITVENLDTGKFLFRKDLCETSGYTYFNPFFLKPEVLGTKITSHSIDDGVKIEFKGNGFFSSLIVKDIDILENGKLAVFKIEREGVSISSKIVGENITKDYLIESIKNLNNTEFYADKACPLCIVLIVAAIVEVCENAQNACSPCNGHLTVGPCSCSCKPA